MIDILSAIEPLRRKPAEEWLGRTPPDWDLKDPSGARFYLEFLVRRDSSEAWLSFIESRAGRRNKAYARGMARSINPNGRRLGKGGKPIGSDPLQAELEKMFLETAQLPRNERRGDQEEYIGKLRELLLIEAHAVPTDAEPVDRTEIEKPIIEAAAALAALGDDEDRVAAEAKVDAATKEVAGRLAPDAWLASDGTGERQALSEAELDALFVAQLHDDAERVAIPKTWSYGDGPRSVTLADALCAVVRDLAGLAAEGNKEALAAEVEAGKEKPSSGGVAKPRRARRTTATPATATAAA